MTRRNAARVPRSGDTDSPAHRPAGHGACEGKRATRRTLAHTPCPLTTRREGEPLRRPRSKSTTGETAPPAAPARRTGGAGRGAARVPVAPSPALPQARALRGPLADKRVYRPRHFHVPLRFAPRRQPPRLRASLRSTVYITGALCKPAGGVRCARVARAALKACHSACFLRARAFAVLGGAAVLNPRARHARARPGARRGPCPRAGSRTRRNENRRCRARKPRTERDAPSATAPKARTKAPASRAHGPRTCPGAEPPRAASWCAHRAHPWHIAPALCEGRDSAPEACGVPPRNEVKREMKDPGTVMRHYRPAATRPGAWMRRA